MALIGDGYVFDLYDLWVFLPSASASEMLGISLCLSGGLRTDIESAFSQSLASYLDCNLIRYALRSQIYSCRALLCIDPVLYGKDVALKFDRLSCDVVAQETYPGPYQSNPDADAVQRQLWVRSRCRTTETILRHAIFVLLALSLNR